MTAIVIMAEETSGKIIAECLSQQLGLSERTICIEHQGCSDLERSFPRKIAAWRSANLPRFIVMRDNDGADCRERKRGLAQRLPPNSTDRVKIRLVVQELESWYLGDPQALFSANLIESKIIATIENRPRFRNPDTILHVKEVFKKYIGTRGQVEIARLIGPHLSLTANRSISFNAFVSALKWAGGSA